ncbi:MAG TPA: SLBB domain-containing protein, partial [Terracidiphilus sp.]|nr:SLBB domain-containing protein [Terracidiphilus sp.]
SPNYVIGPGDQLNITLWGGVSQTNLRIVDREGRVSLPEAGLLPVAGLTLQKAQDLIAAAMQAQFRNAKVAVSVAQVRSIRIYVVGDVQRPGAYEISALASPITALFAAGGPTAIGSLRILRHLRNQILLGEIDLYDFMLHGIRPTDDRLESGDTLLVPPVGPQVAIAGAVRRPAIYELRDEKNLTAVLDDAGGLTVAASLSHITIDRVVANQRREEFAVPAATGTEISSATAAFNAVAVQDGDRVRVASVLPYSERAVYLQGHVARPGKIAYRDGMQLSDVLRSYQDLLPEPADRGEIVRLVPPDLHPETIAFNIPDLLIGNTNAPLQPFDTVRIYGRYELDPSMVSIRGEVQRPGDYPMFKGMTASDLVRTAGGFKRDALIDRADLASYKIEDGTRVVVQRQDVAVGNAVLKRDQASDVPLKPGDVLTIHQLTGWNDIGASVILEGEVAHPGSYGFQEGEHLSDVLRRSGGFRSTAYPEGAVLTRPEVATLEEKSREELIRQIEESAASTRVSPSASGGEQAATLQLIQQQKQQAIAQLRSQPAAGRLVIHIESDVTLWAGTPADIELRSGDTLRIPKRPGFVLVTGQVFNPSAITFIPGRSAGWYLGRAGGVTSTANRKEIFVVRANGAVVGRGSAGWFGRDVLSTHLNPGDTIVVPQRFIGPSVTWRNLLATAQIAASLAIAAAVAGL